MKQIIAFIKDWTLPLALITGVGFYYLFSYCKPITFIRPILGDVVEWLMPALIFTQLLFAFSKTDPKELLPKKWHMWLLLFQLISCFAIAASLLLFKLDSDEKIILEGAMICLIAPTATAAVVITSKLGGNAAALITYTILSNIVAAIVAPLLFPIIDPHEGLTFLNEFTSILGKVFPLLITPFILALIFRYYIKPIHNFLEKYSETAFYLWGFALIIVTAQTLHHLTMSNAMVHIKIEVALAGLLTCIIQFSLGKYIGKRYDNSISAGQALGQKNTVIAIWLASTYLIPLSSLAPGSYILWQNIFNSWQLYKKRKNSN